MLHLQAIKRFPSVILQQVRTATKRASGSRTNKNDSAGRRLGPKVHESNFVKPGQIIMRQRGTKIHPGENTGIGKDHTIFALEPGYVRFYYDPFHPLRKYVGVALKKQLMLPTPHFEPRVRRFGYELLHDEQEASKEEAHMSRKEYLQLPRLQQAEQRNTARDEACLKRYKLQLSPFQVEPSDLATHRLLSVYKLLKVGVPVDQALAQATYNHIHSLQLQLNKGEISRPQYEASRAEYLAFAADVDNKVRVDYTGALVGPEVKAQAEILDQLKPFENRVLSEDDKAAIKGLIESPLVFNLAERATLLGRYLPAVLPETVAETVVVDPPKKAKDLTLVRKFDPAAKKVVVIGRTKQAFV